MNTSNSELGCWLVMHRYVGLGPSRLASLLAYLHQQAKCLSDCFNGTIPTQEFIRWGEKHKVDVSAPNWKGVEKDLAFSRQPNTHIITSQDSSYPQHLKEIPGAPSVLFVKGNLEVLQLPQLAIVGSRVPTQQGRENAFEFAYACAQKGFVITSGLALGIDAASHEGAISAKGLTIGVLGSGLDKLYPAANRALAKRICETGALVSEFSMGVLPSPKHFPRRNRIISGLSLGVLVVESTLKSGSLITANYALEQGREVFAIPGSIHNPLSKGCNQLIRQGAKCVESVVHILEELPTIKGNLDKTSMHAAILNSIEKPIDKACTTLDTIVSMTGLTPQALSPMLLELEIEGKVASVPGGYVRVSAGD